MFIMCVLFEYNNEYELILRIRCRIRMGIAKKNVATYQLTILSE